MASKHKKSKKLDLYWSTLFILIIGVLVGALFLGKYLGDKFINAGNLSSQNSDNSIIKTLSKPTIAIQNSDISSGNGQDTQIILPPSFNVTQGKHYDKYSSSIPDKNATPVPKSTTVAAKDDENKFSTPKPVANNTTNNYAPVPEDSTSGKTNSDLSQMINHSSTNQSEKNSTVQSSQNNGFERVELNDVSSPSEDNKDSSGTYKVQAGLYVDKNNAKDMAEDLSKNGYDATVVQVTNDNGKTFYRVQTGSFNNKSNAQNLENKLKENNYDATVVKEGNQ